MSSIPAGNVSAEDLAGPPSRGSYVTVATCNLNQWALDFDGNAKRTLRSCVEARDVHGASYRLGPELELCGYGCEDHFLESDTFAHCWESLAWLLDAGATDGLLCDFGMPVLHGGARYNCRVLVRDRRVLLVRPKTALADGGNYREGRYFTAYVRPEPGGPAETVSPPGHLPAFAGAGPVPFGLQFLACADGTTVGCESCEELWTPRATHIDMALAGVEIIGNGSGSHHELRKLHTRIDLMRSATRKCGGVYLYANQRGCDGGRLYYDGCAVVVCNGEVLAQASQFSVDDVEVISATVDLDDVRSYRASIPSFGRQAARGAARHYISVAPTPPTPDAAAAGGTAPPCDRVPSLPIELAVHSPEEECCMGPACWMWDYLRRSGASGFFLPLSGGADSSATAAIVYVMCTMVHAAAHRDPDGAVAAECRRICHRADADAGRWVPDAPQTIAAAIFHTCYMGTTNSSEATRSRAQRLGAAIGAYHLAIGIDPMVDAAVAVFGAACGRIPRFSSRGGTTAEDLALQNIQARLRMVVAYLLAQLLPWVRKASGFLLVVASANVDEGLRGYMTKYDCSSADLNPIGSISKMDLARMLRFVADRYGLPVLTEIADAPPTAELRPQEEGDADGEHSQKDEDDMGMTYEELGIFGALRKVHRCGPVSMFRRLRHTWAALGADEVAVKVKRFFYYYSVNRHKMCVITPSYHAEGYSPDDNRFDLRPFVYNTRWTRQFAAIDRLVAKRKTPDDAQESAGPGDPESASKRTKTSP